MNFLAIMKMMTMGKIGWINHQPNSNLKPFTNKSNGLLEHMGESF